MCRVDKVGVEIGFLGEVVLLPHFIKFMTSGCLMAVVYSTSWSTVVGCEWLDLLARKIYERSFKPINILKGARIAAGIPNRASIG